MIDTEQRDKDWELILDWLATGDLPAPGTRAAMLIQAECERAEILSPYDRMRNEREMVAQNAERKRNPLGWQIEIVGGK
jgi:hypothetical protein